MTKIIIDPGHVGEKVFDLRDFNVFGRRFQEGSFCYFWADCVAELLTDRGFEVELTRARGRRSLMPSKLEVSQRIDELLSAHELDFLLKKYHVPAAWFPQLTKTELLEAVIENEFDLLNRAQLINGSRADLALSLHLNGNPTAPAATANGICGFTNRGSETHFEFFSDMIALVGKELQMGTYKGCDFPQPFHGLFIRNDLILCNNVEKPFLLLEGPFQNHRETLEALSAAQQVYESSGSVTGMLASLTNAVVQAICGQRDKL